MVFHLRREPAAFAPNDSATSCSLSTLFGQAVANLAQARELQEAERSMKEQYDIIAKLSNTVMNSAMDLKDYSKELEQRVRERTAELHEAHVDTIYMLAVASEAKDQDTGDHLRRIYRHTQGARGGAGHRRRRGRRLAYAGVLHDVGKMHVPDHILKKPGPLTPDEMKTMQEHTVWGERILGEKPFFAAARRIARSHHENWDGSGYPDGVRGDGDPDRSAHRPPRRRLRCAGQPARLQGGVDAATGGGVHRRGVGADVRSGIGSGFRAHFPAADGAADAARVGRDVTARS